MKKARVLAVPGPQSGGACKTQAMLKSSKYNIYCWAGKVNDATRSLGSICSVQLGQRSVQIQRRRRLVCLIHQARLAALI